MRGERVPETVDCGVLQDAGRLHGQHDRAIDSARVQVMAANACARIYTRCGGEDPLPTPLNAGARIFPFDGRATGAGRSQRPSREAGPGQAAEQSWKDPRGPRKRFHSR